MTLSLDRDNPNGQSRGIGPLSQLHFSAWAWRISWLSGTVCSFRDRPGYQL
jgi:hypothetical protein